VSATVTVAPTITPPLWSVRVPKIRPELPCENAGRQIRKTKDVAHSNCTARFTWGTRNGAIVDGRQVIMTTSLRFDG
jgi:hypothetical protein